MTLGNASVHSIASRPVQLQYDAQTKDGNPYGTRRDVPVKLDFTFHIRLDHVCVYYWSVLFL